MKPLVQAFAAVALAMSSLTAQQPGRNSAGEDPSSYTVKTIPLHHLSNGDAVLLLNPYVSGKGGVYPVGPSIHAVTIRASLATIADMEKLLAQYDRSPVTVSLNFQLISADYTNNRDASLAGLDSVLRNVLKFSGYHLMRVAVVNISEGNMASQTLSADGETYRLTYTVTEISGVGADATVHLKVDLRRIGLGSTFPGAQTVDPSLLNTGVTIPIGHTVVLGSTMEAATPAVPNTSGTPGNARVPPRTSPMTAAGSDRALILTVRPQVAAGKD